VFLYSYTEVSAKLLLQDGKIFPLFLSTESLLGRGWTPVTP